MNVTRPRRRAIAATVAAALVGTLSTVAAGLSPSDAAAAADGSVGTVPASFTPWLSQSAPGQHVQRFAQCGGTMYAVGTISTVNQGTSTYQRSNAFSFSATTGAVTSWAPQVNGSVFSVALSPDCSTAYLGGQFSAVNGTTAKNIVAVDTSTGAIRTGFARNANAPVETLNYTGGTLLAGGSFTSINGSKRTVLASLSPSTGAATAYANLPISGGYPASPRTRLYNSQVNHAGTKMLVEGVFTSVGGQPRQQIAMLDLTGGAVSVDAWNAPEFNQLCSSNANFAAKGATWSPDDATVYVATTAYKPISGPGSTTGEPRAGVCDAAIAFPSTATTVTHRWINYTGCDSLFAVAADTQNVYVGGHERYANNGFGCDGPGPGAVPRQGIGAVSSSSGLATDWNPTRSRGHGVSDLLLTPAGLWVGSDNGSKSGASQTCGHRTNKGGICFFPY